MNTARLIAKSKSWLRRESPTILTVIGAIGVVATAVTAVKATPKALAFVDEEIRKQNRALLDEAEKNENDVCAQINKLKPIEVVKVAWKPYIPSVIIGTATIACIFGANVLNQRQQAALTSAYIFLERSYKEYKDKVKAVLGEDAAKRVDEAIVKDRFTEEEMMPNPSGDKCLFYLDYYGKFFERSMLEVRDAEYQLNRKLSKDGEVNLNYFMALLDLPEVEFGNILGWSQEDAFDNYNYTWIEFEHVMLQVNDDLECYEIKFLLPPSEGYDVPF